MNPGSPEDPLTPGATDDSAGEADELERVALQPSGSGTSRSGGRSSRSKAAHPRASGDSVGSRGRTRRDSDEPLPKKVKWTIVVTAVLLLTMSFILVGVTLRMAPLIDEMVRKENEEMLKMLTQSNVNVQPEHRPDNGSTGTSTSTPHPPNSEG